MFLTKEILFLLSSANSIPFKSSNDFELFSRVLNIKDSLNYIEEEAELLRWLTVASYEDLAGLSTWTCPSCKYFPYLKSGWILNDNNITIISKNSKINEKPMKSKNNNILSDIKETQNDILSKNINKSELQKKNFDTINRLMIEYEEKKLFHSKTLQIFNPQIPYSNLYELYRLNLSREPINRNIIFNLYNFILRPSPSVNLSANLFLSKKKVTSQKRLLNLKGTINPETNMKVEETYNHWLKNSSFIDHNISNSIGEINETLTLMHKHMIYRNSTPQQSLLLEVEGQNFFIGTSTLENWIDNLALLPGKVALDSKYCWGIKGCKVHPGFLYEWDLISETLINLLSVSKCQQLILTGHSLGGSLAVLAAAHIEYLWPNFVQAIVTFGQPRIGNSVFALQSTIKLRGRFMRVTHHKDPVPLLPLKMMNYTHGGYELFYKNIDGLQHIICEQKESMLEDPDCISGNSFLIGPNEIKDHSSYLDIPEAE